MLAERTKTSCGFHATVIQKAVVASVNPRLGGVLFAVGELSWRLSNTLWLDQLLTSEGEPQDQDWI